ncbi:unnamed protein product [Brachionus calyciflorus]|uniref:BTB domain-containing protein n=1 Tax=Brachionus calyciflorus TaxID=104777 RepID=A0A813XRG1_9BILA|nr:unnamed protein product [Brachionus calyciflorus]
MSNNENEVNLWVSSIVNIESKSDHSLKYLESILGPVKNDPLSYSLGDELNPSESQISKIIQEEINNEVQKELEGVFMHEIIFKVEEKIFIEKINIYEKLCPGSCILKIEALEKQIPEKWFVLWETKVPLNSDKPKLFAPNIKSSPFKTDTIKFTVCGSIYLIDGIEIKGNKIAIGKEDIKENQMSSLSRNLKTLVQNELFADVYFEVDGKLIPAHRNILVYRSEYFRAMLSQNGHFKENFSMQDPIKNPIYIKDIEFDIFLEVLNFLYSGHVNTVDNDTNRNLLIGIMRAADKMNLIELGKLCLYHLTEMIDEDNVIRIFVEACDSENVLHEVLSFCYEVISSNFKKISSTVDFCSLKQELMIKIIENVIPKLNRLTSSVIEGSQNATVTIPASQDLGNTESNDSDDSDDSD